MNGYYILDTGGILLRRYFGANDSSVESDNGNGKPISDWRVALQDFITKDLMPILEQGALPGNIIACFDSGNNYRRKVYSAYKERRREKEISKEQREQTGELMTTAKRLLAHLGCKVTWVPGEEADDLIALFCERLPGMKAVYTHDADLLALVSPETIVIRSGEPHIFGSENHKVPYRFVSLHKSLVGDSSDNYSGIPGFGEKSWSQLAKDLGEEGLASLQEAIDTNNWKALDPLFGENESGKRKLLEHWSTWRTCWKLAKLTPEACYGEFNGSPKLPRWFVRIPNRGRVRDVLKGMMEYAGPFEDTEQAAYLDQFDPYFPSQKLLTLEDHAELVAAAQEIASSPIVAYDFETVDRLNHQPFKQAAEDRNFVDVLSQELVGMSVNYGRFKEKTIYVPFDHKETRNFPKEWAQWLLTTIDSGAVRPVVQNASFELTVRKTNFPSDQAKAPFDTAIMASYVDENSEAHLKGMARNILNYKQATYAEVTGGRTMDQLTGEEVLSYGCDDSLVTAHLFDLYRIIMQIEKSWQFYEENEVEPVVNDVLSFVSGIDIDFDKLERMRVDTANEIEEQTRKIDFELMNRCAPEQVDQLAATQAAQALLRERWLTEQYKFDMTAEEGKAKAYKRYQDLWEEAWSSCFYVPRKAVKRNLQVIQAMEDFVPTLSRLNQVVAVLDESAPKLAKQTKGEIASFIARLKQHAGEGNKQLLVFADLLLRAQTSLAPGKRSGSDYEELRGFCLQVLGDRVKPKKSAAQQQEGLNFGSSKQMQGLLYGLLRLPVRRRSKPSEGSLRATNDLPGPPAVGLKAIAAALVYDVTEDDWRKEVLDSYQKICKNRQLQSLYFNKLPLWVHPRDGKVHPYLRNCGTVTRRPSGAHPNFLQVAKGPIRTLVLPGKYEGDEEERVVISIDLSNQELVILGYESGDKTMLDAFMSTPRKDLHSLTSTGFAHKRLPALGVKVEGRLTYEQFMEGRKSSDPSICEAYNKVRNKYAKACNFLIAYGGSFPTLAENLLIPEHEAKDLIDSSFALYPGVKIWQNETSASAREKGYVTMAYGTRRHAEKELWLDDRSKVKRQERQLCNAVIQSGAAEILKVIRQRMVDRAIVERHRVRMILPIYDEVTASVPLSAAKDYIMEMADIMRVTPPGKPVGMEVEVSIGKTWGSQIEIGIPAEETIVKVLEELKSGKSD